MVLIVSGNPPPKKGGRRARGQKSSSVLANQAQTELDRIVDDVLADMGKILPDWASQPEAAAIVTALGSLQSRWTAEIARRANQLAERWIGAVDEHSREELTTSLKKTLGVEHAKILDTPGMRATVVAMGREASVLIKSIPGELLAGVANAVVKSYNQEGLPEGRSLSEEIEFISGHAKKRARLIARDQTQKMHGVVTRARQAELGITEFIWRTMRDSRVVGTPGGMWPDPSRLHGNHYEREGKTYRWDNLPPDGGPGWGINCRCYAEPVIDMAALDIATVSTPTMDEAGTNAKPPARRPPDRESFAGFNATRDRLLDRLLEQEKILADAPATMDITGDEFKDITAEARREARALRVALAKLRARGLKQASDSKITGVSAAAPIAGLPPQMPRRPWGARKPL